MLRRIMVGLVVTGVTMSLTTVAHAEDDPAQPHCVGLRYQLWFGEGISVTCLAGSTPSAYRVVAHCATGAAEWHQFGTWVQPGFGPSDAACVGALLGRARVVGYDMETKDQRDGAGS